MLKTLQINKTCISCDACRLLCPENAILTNGEEYTIDMWSCSTCGICIEVCPSDCIVFKEKEDQPYL